MHIRNSFAHNPLGPVSINICLNEDGSTNVADMYLELESISGSGAINKVKRRDALHCFTQSNMALHQHLIAVLQLLEETKE